MSSDTSTVTSYNWLYRSLVRSPENCFIVYDGLDTKIKGYIFAGVHEFIV